VGIYKDDYDFDTDMLETDTFAKNWPKLEGKKVGIQIEHGKSKNNKVKSVAKKWLSVAEAKAEMAKKGTVGIKPEAVKAETDAGVWGSEE
jgi:hypothetical protein